MSYILDALKKSEQERGRGSSPGIQTIHSSSINYHRDKRTYWPYILIFIALLNLVAIIYFITDKDKGGQDQAELSTSQTSSPLVNETSTSKSMITAPPKINTADAVDVAEPQSKTEIDIETQKYEPVAAAKPATEPDLREKTIDIPVDKQKDIINYHELPDSIKQGLPAILISAHVYSSNPLHRSIVINNNFMEEGEYVIDSLILHEITPGGAIFDYDNILFRYDVVSGWQ